MQNPTALYRFETDAELGVPRPGVLVVALGAFIDAGHIQQVLSGHLLETGDPEVVASFDVDQLLDYRGRRPAMVFDTNRWVEYEDPAMLLHRLTDRDGQTYYLLTGPEPDYQWERVIEAIRELIGRLGITLVVHTHGIPMAVPHTRPVGMTAHATDAALIGDTASPFGRVQVPGSIGALLELRLGEAGQQAVGFAIHVPHYLAGSEFAEGALAALNAVVDVTGLNLPNDDLVTRARMNQQAIAAEVDTNDEASQVVSALEQQYDAFVEGQQRPSLLATEASQIPSAEELGEDFENFLRTVADDDPGRS
ncbi:proteasome assembly chaperone family protein [Oryzobacter telluris]|uniref:proteasome assembly chaperone family protein n=1 Tax=Oryzobacter telluris TaxID=3149179 RepID=UPI00370DD162